MFLPEEKYSLSKQRSAAVRQWILLIAFTLFLTCEKFPSNPVQVPLAVRTASVTLAETRYEQVDPPGEGLVASKVNILCFKVQANFSARSIELIGKSKVEGPPETREHAFHFRTDQIDSMVPSTSVVFNVLSSVEAETVYVLFRYQFPMNEYSPFVNDQGKVSSVTVDEVWAVDKGGNRFPVSLDPPVK
jgi:hypothetical protein